MQLTTMALPENSTVLFIFINFRNNCYFNCMCVRFDITSKITTQTKLAILIVYGRTFFKIYDKFMIYEYVIVSDDIHSTVFVFLDVDSTAYAVCERNR